MQHGATRAYRMPASGSEHACDVTLTDSRAGEIDDAACFHPARDGMTKSEHINGVGAVAQDIIGLARPEPGDKASDLAGADIEGSHKSRAFLRQRPHLRSEAGLEGAHALPAFFFVLSFSPSIRACAAASESRTVTRSGSLKSIRTRSRVIRFFSASRATNLSSAAPAATSGNSTSIPFFSRRFQRRSPTRIDA